LLIPRPGLTLSVKSEKGREIRVDSSILLFIKKAILKAFMFVFILSLYGFILINKKQKKKKNIFF